MKKIIPQSKNKTKNDDSNVKKQKIKKSYVFNSKHNIQEIAKIFGISSAILIKQLLKIGIIVNINDTLDKNIIELLGTEFNVEIIFENSDNLKKIIMKKKNIPKLEKRPPIITIMGHVNHGKTTLLDTIRKTRIVDKEFGGITQHIGAYQTNYKGNLITFIDTPGHEIFNQMRARGVQFTDICILILAVDDGVKPQTIEALQHAQAAKVPIIVALNKIDKTNRINLEPIMSELSNYDLLPEIWGGKTPYVEISALKNKGIDQLLELILLISEIENYQTEIKIPAEGHVLESNLAISKGPIATFIIKKGTLKVGDIVVVGQTYGKIRSIENDLKQKLKIALPSQPIKVSGLKEVVLAGDFFMVVKDEVTAKKIVNQKKEQYKKNLESENKISGLENFLSNLDTAETKYLNIILKTDFQGSLEAIKSILEKISLSDVKIKFIKMGVGDISESDINLGQLNSSLIIGFNVNSNVFVRSLAKNKGIKINLYNVIYRIYEDVEKIMKSLLKTSLEEKVIGQAEVRKIFNISTIGTIAGCYVISGMITNDSLLRVIRNKKIIHQGKIISLKHLKDNIPNSKKGHECGILVENFSNFEINDIIEAYKLEKAEN
ncbi:translation initiation factor IF-2 [Candidatus Phytoplasma mali]|uniref:translation initiation factor IF-2 n=1 Tax=Apple proliferation phytoplasma TaxID=37692 RepID=UPI0003047593|nr:translation initiation factor IF-2 [Candidatus Phytoplasma mali]